MAAQLLLLLAGLLLLLLFFLWRARWQRARLLATVPVEHLVIASQPLANERSVTVYLPPGYRAQSQRRYPVLYVNDGQDMEPLQMRATLARLYRQRRLEPLIVIAIPTNADRLHEYGTSVAPNAQGLGNRAAAYTHFVTEELMPLVNERYHTFTAPQHVAFLGASLGGLSAFDIVWSRPQLFGIVGVMSGSFWWRAAADEIHAPPGEQIARALVRQGGRSGPLRAWFEAATLDEVSDRDNNGIIDAIQDTLELIEALQESGAGPEVVYVEVAGGRHNYQTWARVLPHFLMWAFPPQSALVESGNR